MHHLQRREEARKCANGSGLRGASVSEDEDPADGRIHGGEAEGKLHLLLPDDRGDRIEIGQAGLPDKGEVASGR